MALTVLASLEFPRSATTHASTMTLYAGENHMIEWDVPAIGQTLHIGLWFEGKNLSDYDGVFELPKQAVALIRKAGFVVGHEFTRA